MVNYAKIYYNDVANGTGCRTALFVSGCTHHCKGCFNEVTWDFNYGDPFTDEVMDEIIKSLEPSYINGLTILGGEPMEISNQEAIYPLIKKIRDTLPGKTIWVYSGYTLEELTDTSNRRCNSEFTKKILENIDILVDGEFDLEKRDISLRFRGSSNQRVIDMKETLKRGTIVLSGYGNK